jgi:hypothetical protein
MEKQITTDRPPRRIREKKRTSDSGPRSEAAASVPGEPEVNREGAEVEVEVEVVRLPPNPRLVICRCVVGGFRCKVWVGRNSNFVPGMRFKVHKSAVETSSVTPWKYDGALPRRKGRW